MPVWRKLFFFPWIRSYHHPSWLSPAEAPLRNIFSSSSLKMRWLMRKIPIFLLPSQHASMSLSLSHFFLLHMLTGIVRAFSSSCDEDDGKMREVKWWMKNFINSSVGGVVFEGKGNCKNENYPSMMTYHFLKNNFTNAFHVIYRWCGSLAKALSFMYDASVLMNIKLSKQVPLRKSMSTPCATFFPHINSTCFIAKARERNFKTEVE